MPKRGRKKQTKSINVAIPEEVIQRSGNDGEGVKIKQEEVQDFQTLDNKTSKTHGLTLPLRMIEEGYKQQALHATFQSIKPHLTQGVMPEKRWIKLN